MTATAASVPLQLPPAAMHSPHPAEQMPAAVQVQVPVPAAAQAQVQVQVSVPAATQVQVPGRLLVAFFCALVTCREAVALAFLRMCGTLGEAVRAYCFCPTFQDSANYQHVVWGPRRADKGVPHCFFCSTALQGGRVRVAQVETSVAHGKLLSFPRDREVWDAMAGASIVCVVCWDHAAYQRSLTNHCSKTGLVPAACALNRTYAALAPLAYDAAEAFLAAATTATGPAGTAAGPAATAAGLARKRKHPAP